MTILRTLTTVIALSMTSLTLPPAYANAASEPGKTSMFSVKTGYVTPVDVTKWFSNGMYEPMVIDGQVSQIMMVRKDPFVFKAEDNDFVVQAVIEALDKAQPRISSQSIWDAWPVLTRRVRYSHSIFLAPDRPEDLYVVYLQMSYRRYTITFGIDVNTDAILYEGEAEEIKGHEGEEDIVKVFNEMDDAGTR